MTVKAGRPDLDATVRIPTLHAGEPVFIVRGQDPNAEGTVRDWAARAKAAGVDTAIIEQALRQADALARYGPKKLPGLDHLTDAEAKQLRYSHGRRAWNARTEAATPEILLAEQRGWDAAVAAMRAGKVV